MWKSTLDTPADVWDCSHDYSRLSHSGSIRHENSTKPFSTKAETWVQTPRVRCPLGTAQSGTGLLLNYPDHVPNEHPHFQQEDLVVLNHSEVSKVSNIWLDCPWCGQVTRTTWEEGKEFCTSCKKVVREAETTNNVTQKQKET